MNRLTTLFILGGFIYVYNNHYISYQIVNTIVSPFQNEYEKSAYYKFKVPDEWFFVRKDDDSSTFIGPTWNDKEEYTSAIVFTDFEELENYIHYFSKDNCKDIDAHTQVKNILHITPVCNNGIALGLFKEFNLSLLVAVTLATSLFILYMIFVKKPRSRLLVMALFLILSGAVGTLTDRITYGYVLDFIDLRVWPGFTFADSVITIGALLILIYLFKTKSNAGQRKPKT